MDAGGVMWISRRHYELIAEKAREFREWHEQRVKFMEQNFCERLAERDSIIAKREDELRDMQGRMDVLVDRLTLREDRRNEPPMPIPEVDGSWEAVLRQQIEELSSGQS